MILHYNRAMSNAKVGVFLVHLIYSYTFNVAMGNFLQHQMNSSISASSVITLPYGKYK